MDIFSYVKRKCVWEKIMFIRVEQVIRTTTTTDSNNSNIITEYFIILSHNNVCI